MGTVRLMGGGGLKTALQRCLHASHVQCIFKHSRDKINIKRHIPVATWGEIEGTTKEGLISTVADALHNSLQAAGIKYRRDVRLLLKQ